MSTIFLNGQFVDSEAAKVSVFDGGFLHGAGLFETMRAENGRVFRLEAHLDRLRNSTGKLLRPIERDVLPAERVFAELLERDGLRSARVRLTATAGSMVESGEASPELTICVTATPLRGYPETMYQQGVTVVICQFRQSPGDPTAGHKTTSYLPRLLGLREAQAARCPEALWFTTSNHLAEGSISNVFLLSDGVLRTPPLNTPVLPGIARAVVIELGGKLGLAVEERPLTINDLLDASEVLLTNSIMQVMPVVRVEKHDIGGAQVGATARRLLEAYRERVREECQG